MFKDPDVIVIGAGAAGLAAAAALGQAGLRVVIVEARDRIGGRIFTMRDSARDVPVELGAEFIHGRPTEILERLKRRRISITEVKGDNWCLRDGNLGQCDFFAEVEKILGKMDARAPDQSFLEFLEQCCPDSKANRRIREAKAWAASYVSGFNAADPALVGVHWLTQEMRAEEKIEGDRAFRSRHGYSDLIAIFEQELKASGVSIHKNMVVKSVEWRAGHVTVTAQVRDRVTEFSAPRLLVTVPLGVLQAPTDQRGAIRFKPELPEKKKRALGTLEMGKVIRITLRFRERFWKDLPHSIGRHSKTMAGMSFLFSHDEWFPTWWTSRVKTLPMLTGWAPFRSAERLSGRRTEFVTEQGLHTLHRLMGVSARDLESLLEDAYCHDWQADPFSRGAYSYGKVGADRALQSLAMPLEDTLFFAGEATDNTGNNGTVHGAIASGDRAAAEIARSAGLRR